MASSEAIDRGGATADGGGASAGATTVTLVRVDRIRPEEGLGRKRDREGHLELQQSIRQFGVLTPITVRPAGDDTDDYLLIKGQGRTLACRILGLDEIPAIVVDESYGQDEKVRQFLVENVARLRMRPVDRALLIRRARENGEETTDIARRFGVAATTVRRLLAQLEDASTAEVAALRSGEISLSLHAVIARHVDPADRDDAVIVVSGAEIRTKELEAIFVGLGWSELSNLGLRQRAQRMALLSWACYSMSNLPNGSVRERIRRLALHFPAQFEDDGATLALVSQ
ncbi:ParB/RepB/Spo0J family partition protein [Cellulomonas humilata]|uniref:ParB/RepB/Spo0J family partition protein n=1 Tax=Cellulomonas humilata TaxID=144055 RepID=A0ABU0EMC6_9CELL|nr:ParB/RepB/Spo0J family partition protein [Cellulomonas humilata]MDQ0375967.1 ParB/RepB/Spo0J family partition protein [Cellulomonas humilata]